MRYFKATLFCGLLASLIAVGLFELGAFRRLDAQLAAFLEQASPPVVGRAWQYFLIFLLGCGIAWTTVELSRPAVSIFVALAACAECVTAVWVLNLYGGFFSPFASLTAIVLAFAGAFIYAHSTAGRRKQTLRELLGDRVSPQTFTALLESNTPLSAEGDAREATVIVCELFNREELAAVMPAPDYVSMTNAFLRNAADFLVERGGYLADCDGERLRVLFGAPLPDERHAVRACEAALDLLTRLDAVNRECHTVWSQRFQFGIGINSGRMILAAYGSRQARTFSVTGEAAEFARRLCAANAIYGSRILLGNGAFVLAGEAIEVRPMELIQRQRDESAREEVYELFGRRNQLSPGDVERRDEFWKGIALFRQQRWDAALAAFCRAAELSGDDGPAEFYIRRTEQLRAGLPALDGAGSRV